MKLFAAFNNMAAKKAATYLHSLRNTVKPKELVKTTALSMLFFGHLYWTNSQKSKAASPDQNSQHFFQPPPDDFKSSFQPYNHKAFDDAIKGKKLVAILVDEGNLRPDFLTSVENQLKMLIDLHKNQKFKEIVPFVFSPKTLEEQKDFENHHKISLPEGTLVLMKNKYINKIYPFTIREYIDNPKYMLQYYRKLMKLDDRVIGMFKDSLAHLHSANVIIATYNPKDEPQYQKIRNNLSILALQNFSRQNDNTYFIQIKDKKSAEELNLKDAKPGDVFVLTKRTAYNFRRSNLDLNGAKIQVINTNQNLGGRVGGLLESIDEIVQDNFVFLQHGFGHRTKPWRLQFEVNRNRMNPKEYKELVQRLSDLHLLLKEKHPELYSKVSFELLNSEAQTKKGYRLVACDVASLSNSIRKATNTDPAQIPKETESHTHEYLFESKDLSQANLLKFVQDAVDRKLPEFYRSQKVPKYAKYSKKVVSKTLNQSLHDGKHHALFFYSKHCHSCKVYGGYYENLAVENLKNPSSDLGFIRMNSDKNMADSIPPFYFTPVFLVARKEYPTKPILFRSQSFTPTILQEFFELSTRYKIIPQEVVNEMFSETKIKQMAEANQAAQLLQKSEK